GEAERPRASTSRDVCWVCSVFSICVFFFQAEDGIRDRNVTGVQTCALPILSKPIKRVGTPSKERLLRFFPPAEHVVHDGPAGLRSEERRVGKECRSRRGPER